MTAIPLSELATSRRWQSNFLAILPAVQIHASIQFRHLPAEAREEATSEAVAAACVSYADLARKEKLDCAYVGNIATFAVKRVRAQRSVAGSWNSRDVLSPLTQKKRGIAVSSLTPWDGAVGAWRDLLVASRNVSPADQACFNLDFTAWLRTWSARHRLIIAALAAGHRVMSVAKKFSVTQARISQLRRVFERSWHQFQGTDNAVPAASGTS